MRRGSMAYYPRKRAKTETPRFKSWPKVEECKPLAFYGYKVGMTHILVKEKVGKEIKEYCYPVTIIECPPMKVVAIRAYKKTKLGLKTLGEFWTTNLPKEIFRRIPKIKKEHNKEDFEKILENADEVRIICCTQPKLTTIGKKKCEVVEIALGGNLEEKKQKAFELLGKEIRVSDVFNNNQLIDVKAVTKGKGFQGAVKRFGVFDFSHIKDKTKRGVGAIGQFTPGYTMWTVPMPGQMGYHTRTEFNKQIVLISNPKELNINPKSGWPHYGVIRNDYVIILGSVPGPQKRLIGMRFPVRKGKLRAIERIEYIDSARQFVRCNV